VAGARVGTGRYKQGQAGANQDGGMVRDNSRQSGIQDSILHCNSRWASKYKQEHVQMQHSLHASPWHVVCLANRHSSCSSSSNATCQRLQQQAGMLHYSAPQAVCAPSVPLSTQAARMM
jgi:hypothetical protein